ncbi:hypothetical protein ACFWAR_33005 [Streptomyces sp. NPDC059917]|uniref:hypothetical protein n=1 Tax=Streptomyces sp. NPDC059917 TaxID=3347002 RepID=UPI003656E442
MTKTQRMLAALALAGATAGFAAATAPVASAAPITLPDLPVAPGTPEGATPRSVQEIGAKVSEPLQQLNQLMTLPDQLSPLTDTVAPVTNLATGIE